MTFDPNYYLTQYNNYFCEKLLEVLYCILLTVQNIIIHANMIYNIYTHEPI